MTSATTRTTPTTIWAINTGPAGIEVAKSDTVVVMVALAGVVGRIHATPTTHPSTTFMERVSEAEMALVEVDMLVGTLVVGLTVGELPMEQPS